MIFHVYYTGVFQLHDYNHRFSQFYLKLRFNRPAMLDLVRIHQGIVGVITANRMKSLAQWNSIVGTKFSIIASALHTVLVH